MADKSRDAFRTISEVADWLGVQPHVLRFWESKFSQVKPVKRAGGRRYYRPADMQLLGGIRKLLHEDGLTIKGAQKVLREAGMAHVAAMSPPLDTETAAIVESSAPAEVAETTMPTEPEVAAPAQGEEQEPAQEPRDEPGSLPSFLSDAPVDTDTSETADPEPADNLPSFLTQGNDDKTTDGTPSQDFEPPSQVIEAEQNFDTAQPEPESATSALYDDLLASDEGEASQAQSEETLEPAEETSEVDPAPPQTEGSSSVLPDPVVPDEEAPAPLSDPEPATEHEDTALADAPSDAPAATETEDTAPIDSPRPNIVDAPDPDDSSFDVAPSTLAAAFRTVSLDDETRGAVTPLVAQLAALRDRMAAARGR